MLRKHFTASFVYSFRLTQLNITSYEKEFVFLGSRSTPVWTRILQIR